MLAPGHPWPPLSDAKGGVPSIYSSARTGSEHTVLLSQVVDHILLLAVEPASQNEE